MIYFATKFPQVYDMESVKMKRDGWRWSKEKLTNTNEADIEISKIVNENTSIIHAGKNFTKTGGMTINRIKPISLKQVEFLK